MKLSILNQSISSVYRMEQTVQNILDLSQKNMGHSIFSIGLALIFQFIPMHPVFRVHVSMHVLDVYIVNINISTSSRHRATLTFIWTHICVHLTKVSATFTLLFLSTLFCSY